MSFPVRGASTADAPTAVHVHPALRWLQHENAPALAAIAVALLVRCAHIFRSDFPLNDGGLFYLMTQELQAAHFRLPAFTAYNGAEIPFAYPPASFYLAGALNSLTGIPLTQLLRFIPLLATSLLVVAFWRLARSILRDRVTVGLAVLAFALVPRSYSWLLMGGGLTRSLGLLFAVLAIHQAYLFYTGREWRHALVAGLCCALTVLSHLGTVPFVALSIALFFAFCGRHRRGVLGSVVIAASTLLLSAPWWATVIARHGMEPFLAAQRTGGSLADPGVRYTVMMRLVTLNVSTTGEPLFPLVAVLALLGGLVALRPRWIVLPIWWVAIIVLDFRAGETYAVVPASMLAALGVVSVLAPALRAAYGQLGLPRVRGIALLTRARNASPMRFVPAALLAGLLLYATAAAAIRTDYGRGDGRYMIALKPTERADMRWVAERTPAASRFLVVTGMAWHVDRVAEWFPVLAGRVSVATVQGAEWHPGFDQRITQYDALQHGCAERDGRCLAAWADSTGRPFSHVYVVRSPQPAGCCNALVTALERDPEYERLRESPTAAVFRRRSAPPERQAP